MRPAWPDAWGGARGAVIRLAPSTRLGLGIVVILACVISPVTTGRGAALVAALVAGWIFCCRPPGRVLKLAVVLSLVLFLPYFLLGPWLPAEGPLGAASVPWAIAARGASAVLVGLPLASTLSGSDLREALARLPGPRALAAIAVQIVHQVGSLSGETRRIAAALALRGGVGRRTPAVRVLAAFAQVWMPRVIDRAGRVAMAMELRGYREVSAAAPAEHGLGPRDRIALGVGGLVLALAAAARWVS